MKRKTYDDVVYAAIDTELATARWQHMVAEQKEWVRNEACAAATRFITAHPGGPAPRAGTLVEQAAKRYHQQQ